MADRIILVRHGETPWNVAEIFRGRAEIGLDETGLKQAQALGKYLENYKVEAVYASPLKRALETAQKIAAHHQLEPRIDFTLIDFDYGDWQGLSHPQVKDRYPELYARWKSHPERVKMPNGESLDEVRKRTGGLIQKIVTGHAGTVLLVTHRVIIKVLICLLMGMDISRFWNIKMDPGAFSVFSYEDAGFILEEHNNTCQMKLAGATSDF